MVKLDRHNSNQHSTAALSNSAVEESVFLSASSNPCLNEAIKEIAIENNLICEPDYVLSPDLSPNDTLYSSLWGMQGTYGLGEPTAWDTSDGSGVIVAVIDTGVDITHPDLAANIWTNPDEIPSNGIDDDGNGYIDDVNGWDFYDSDNDPTDDDGHGTHVSGTVAAVGDNNLGVIGAAYNAKIMPLRFIGPYGGYTSDAILAINYAVEKGVKISNNSWGGAGFSTALKNTISAAGDQGMLFVAAAGNDTEDTDSSPHYPSAYDLDNIVSVGSIDSSGAISNFSNYGATTVDLFAPGGSIRSTLPSSSYGYYSGTSMASPHVAGVAAQILSVNDSLTAGQMKDALLNNASSDSAYLSQCVTGARLNAANSVAAIEPPAATPTPTATPTPIATPSATPAVEDPGDENDEEPSYELALVSNDTENSIAPGNPYYLDVLGEEPGEKVRLQFFMPRVSKGGALKRCGRTRQFALDSEDGVALLRGKASRLSRYLSGLKLSLTNRGREQLATLTATVSDSIATSVNARRADSLGSRACLSISKSLRFDSQASKR